MQKLIDYFVLLIVFVIVVGIEYNVCYERFDYNVKWTRESDNNLMKIFEDHETKKVFYPEAILIKTGG